MKKNIVLAVILSVLAISAYFTYTYANKQARIVQEIQKQNQGNAQPESTGDENIHVFNPKPGDSVGLPLKILGEARVFESQLNVRIKDKNGKVIKEEWLMTEGGDMGQFNLFKKEINYNKPETTTGTIEFFDYSPKDGSEIDKVIIPIKFAPVYNALTIDVFFVNTEKSANSSDCNDVYPVLRRIPYAKNIEELAIKELLNGLSTDEAQKDYSTSINSGVKLKKIIIKNGTAFVDFDSMLENQIGGSCRVTAIRAQITETLKQFPNISKVEISIDGRSEDILQP